MKYLLLLLVSFSAYAEIENTLNISTIGYEKSDNELGADYQLKTWFELSDNHLIYADLEGIVDSEDNTLFNPLELKYKAEYDNYGVEIGFDTVFWGVAESYNPVDVLNRKNLYTAYDAKDKLGELMLAGEYFFENSTLSAYYLPEFYQQKFLKKQNINTHIVEDEKASYALRYKHIIDNIDIGVSYFSGVSRQHQLLPDGVGKFNAYYPDITQVGLDAQLTTETTLYKFEYAHKEYTHNSKYAAVAGIEYLFVADIAINGLIEYLKSDELTPYQNDVMVGVRFDLENESGTEGVAGVIYDNDYGSKIWTISGSHRLSNNLKLKASAAIYDASDKDVVLQNVQNTATLSLLYYF